MIHWNLCVNIIISKIWLAQRKNVFNHKDIVSLDKNNTLIHWDRDKMDAISQTTFSNAFSWMKMFEYRLKFHWNLFIRVQLTIFQHWFRQWLGTVQATSHYLNQWWLVYRRIYASLGLNELKIFGVFLITRTPQYLHCKLQHLSPMRVFVKYTRILFLDRLILTTVIITSIEFILTATTMVFGVCIIILHVCVCKSMHISR